MKCRAIVFEAVGRASLREIETPEPTARDVVATTLVSGISVGTERWAYIGKRSEIKFPNVPGYMGIGRVTHVGSEAKARVPRGLSISEAVVAIALAETLSWTRHLPSLAGKSVCVAGTGIAGLSIVFWAKIQGAANVIVLGRRSGRIDLARSLGADHGVNVNEGDAVSAVRRLTGGGVDLFLEAVGQNDQLRLGCSLIQPGGTIAVYGVPPGGGNMILSGNGCCRMFDS